MPDNRSRMGAQSNVAHALPVVLCLMAIACMLAELSALTGAIVFLVLMLAYTLFVAYRCAALIATVVSHASIMHENPVERACKGIPGVADSVSLDDLRTAFNTSEAIAKQTAPRPAPVPTQYTFAQPWDYNSLQALMQGNPAFFHSATQTAQPSANVLVLNEFAHLPAIILIRCALTTVLHVWLWIFGVHFLSFIWTYATRSAADALAMYTFPHDAFYDTFIVWDFLRLLYMTVAACGSGPSPVVQPASFAMRQVSLVQMLIYYFIGLMALALVYHAIRMLVNNHKALAESRRVAGASRARIAAQVEEHTLYTWAVRVLMWLYTPAFMLPVWFVALFSECVFVGLSALANASTVAASVLFTLYLAWLAVYAWLGVYEMYIKGHLTSAPTMLRLDSKWRVFRVFFELVLVVYLVFAGLHMLPLLYAPRTDVSVFYRGMKEHASMAQTFMDVMCFTGHVFSQNGFTDFTPHHIATEMLVTVSVTVWFAARVVFIPIALGFMTLSFDA